MSGIGTDVDDVDRPRGLARRHVGDRALRRPHRGSTTARRLERSRDDVTEVRVVIDVLRDRVEGDLVAGERVDRSRSGPCRATPDTSRRRTAAWRPRSSPRRARRGGRRPRSRFGWESGVWTACGFESLDGRRKDSVCSRRVLRRATCLVYVPGTRLRHSTAARRRATSTCREAMSSRGAARRRSRRTSSDRSSTGSGGPLAVTCESLLSSSAREGCSMNRATSWS